MPLLHYNRYWANQAGDKLMMGAGGDAVMLAGASSSPSSGEGLLATCFDGRVIIQTFSDHDFRQADIIPLWQNYVYYTLKNHFGRCPALSHGKGYMLKRALLLAILVQPRFRPRERCAPISPS
jgi:hypothetical protein